VGDAKCAPVRSKHGNPITTLSVGICDDSTEATLSLYGPLISSAREWEQYSTTLLISLHGRRAGRKISIKARTTIEVDPDIGEAEWLRRWVLRDNCSVNEPDPSDLFDIQSTIESPLRLQFTLASLGSFVQASPSQTYTGYLSVILTQLNLIALYKRKQLFSMECCGMPIYSNATKSRCEQCGTNDIDLRINPNLVGEIADETGAISCSATETEASGQGSSPRHINSSRRQHSKILWTEAAWTHLLGRNPDQLAELCNVTDSANERENAVLLKYLQQRLMFMRVILLVGWTGEIMGGRLAVLDVVG
jgi:hypothetical protein